MISINAKDKCINVPETIIKYFTHICPSHNIHKPPNVVIIDMIGSTIKNILKKEDAEEK
jgi:hypothetical protein